MLLVLLPILFSRETAESFEYPKVVLLHLGAILLAALGTARLARHRLAPGEASRLWAVFRDPVVVGVLLLTLSAAASTAASISPLVSLLGADQSFAGLTTVTAYAVLFFATRSLVAGPADARVLLLAPVIAATVAGAYGVVQLAGLDPLAWRRTSEFGGATRPFGTMGHPNFLAAYLVMVLPLGLAFLREAVLRRRWLVAVVLGLSSVLSWQHVQIGFWVMGRSTSLVASARATAGISRNGSFTVAPHTETARFNSPPGAVSAPQQRARGEGHVRSPDTEK